MAREHRKVRDSGKPVRRWINGAGLSDQLSPILATGTILLVAAFRPWSLLHLAYFGALAVALYSFAFRRVSWEPVKWYTFYAFLITVFYILWLLINPDGFHTYMTTGDVDEFYREATAWAPKIFPYGEVWPDFPHYINPYAKLLALVSVAPIRDPLDLVLFNALGLSLIPPATRSVAQEVVEHHGASIWAARLAAICPFTLSHSLVLMRDGWIAALTILAVYALVQSRPFVLIGSLGLATFLRTGSGVLIGVILVALVAARAWQMVRGGATRRQLAVMGLIFGFTIAISLLIALNVMETRGFSPTDFHRKNFLSRLENRLEVHDKTSVTYRLHQLNAPLRTPLTFLYYLGAPYFSPDPLFDTSINLRAVLYNLLYPVLFLPYVAFLSRSSFRAAKDRDTAMLLLWPAFLLSVFVLSQASIQLRHKVQMMPIMYVLVGHGISKRHPVGEAIGLAGATAIITVAIVQKPFFGF